MAADIERKLLLDGFHKFRFPPHARRRIQEEIEKHVDEIVERLRSAVKPLDKNVPIAIIDQGRSGRLTRAMSVPLLRHWGYTVGFSVNGLRILALRSMYRPRSIRFDGRSVPSLKYAFLADRARQDRLWAAALDLIQRGVVQPLVVDTFRGRGVTIDTVKGAISKATGIPVEKIPHFLIAESKDDPLWDAARIIDYYSKREFSDSDTAYKLDYVDAEEMWKGMRVTYERANVEKLQPKRFKKNIASKDADNAH